MKKAAIVLLATLAMSPYADVKDMLLNYGFERVRLTNAGRSRIIDFIKTNNFDSLQIIIDFCDSMNRPNLEWLSPAERFFIDVIRENMPRLKDAASYVKTFKLSDTASDDRGLSGFDFLFDAGSPYRYARRTVEESCVGNPSPVPDNENLYQFLRLTLYEKLDHLRKKSPEESYLWDFLDILFPQLSGTTKFYQMRDLMNTKVRSYLLRYPDSPFFKLVLYNFYYQYKLSRNGGVLGLGPGYQSFDPKTLSLFKERGYFGFYLDIILQGIAYKIDISLATPRLRGSLPVENDTIPSGTSVSNARIMLGAGYLFHCSNRAHLTPYAGLGIFASYMSDSVKQRVNVDSDIKTLYGLSLGASLDYQFAPGSISSLYGEYNPVSLWGFRLDVGILASDFSRLRPDLGSIGYYATVGIQMMGYGQKRVFEVPRSERKKRKQVST
jgi:hypothetical protein